MSREQQTSRKAVPGAGFAATVAGAALFCAFIFPFLWPPSQQVYSAAYAAGSNNKLATGTLALLALLTLCWTWLPQRIAAAEAQAARRLQPATLAVGAALVALWTAGMAIAVARGPGTFGEAGYFLERMRDIAAFHPALYRELEWPYGPLLLLPPVWAAKTLHLSLESSYWASLTLLNVAGVLMAAYVLNRLPLGRPARGVLFTLSCFEQMHPLLGANYSLGKFVLPVAVLVWGTRRRTRPSQAAALAAGHLLTVLVSPELGVGLAGGIVVWACLTAWRERRSQALLSALAPVCGYGFFLAVYGRGFLDRLSHASAGALNLVIEPLPDIYVLLAALVWLAPVAVGLALRQKSKHAPLLAGLFVLALGLLPGALGRADPLHVYFNGWPLLALSAVGLERLGQTRARLWLAALVLLGLEVQATNLRIYRQPLADLAHHHQPLAVDFDPAALRTLTGGQPVAAPTLMSLPLADELALRQGGLLPFDRAAGLSDVWDASSERAKIARLRSFSWALLPRTPYVQSEGSPNDAQFKVLLRGGYRYPQRRQPYRAGELLEQELAANWATAQRYPNAVLMRRAR